jgi:hypothetical protein
MRSVEERKLGVLWISHWPTMTGPLPQHTIQCPKVGAGSVFVDLVVCSVQTKSTAGLLLLAEL